MQRYSIQVMRRYASGVVFCRRRETVISIRGEPIKDNRQKEDILPYAHKTLAVSMNTNWKQGISHSIMS